MYKGLVEADGPLRDNVAGPEWSDVQLSDAREPVCYEQPLNERVRTFLRLEFLFRQLDHHSTDQSEWGRRASVSTLIDILSLLSRSDLKKEILKELGHQHNSLVELESRPGVDPEKLRGTLEELEAVTERMQKHAARSARVNLRDNEFLHAIQNRSAIPGGTCVFDLPVFHFWLNQDAAAVDAEFDEWSSDLQPIRSAVLMFLKLLRGSAAAVEATAENGIYMHKPEAPIQLVRVAMFEYGNIYPEISAGRHRFSVRFLQHVSALQRDSQVHEDIRFRIAMCAL